MPFGHSKPAVEFGMDELELLFELDMPREDIWLLLDLLLDNKLLDWLLSDDFLLLEKELIATELFLVELLFAVLLEYSISVEDFVELLDAIDELDELLSESDLFVFEELLIADADIDWLLSAALGELILDIKDDWLVVETLVEEVVELEEVPPVEPPHALNRRIGKRKIHVQFCICLSLLTYRLISEENYPDFLINRL